MNKKGFMMAEVVVVSAIVLLVITGLYASYNKIYNLYNARIGYYDSTTLFRLGYYRDILIENNLIDEIINNSYNGQIIDVYDSVSAENNVFDLNENETSDYITDKVFFLSKYRFSETVLNANGISETFKDYMKFLSTSVEFNSNHIMIMERCTLKNDNSKNINNCKYAYLEIYDGRE